MTGAWALHSLSQLGLQPRLKQSVAFEKLRQPGYSSLSAGHSSFTDEAKEWGEVSVVD